MPVKKWPILDIHWADRHCWISQRKVNIGCKKELVSAGALLFSKESDK
jgi:hypothetical protein